MFLLMLQYCDIDGCLLILISEKNYINDNPTYSIEIAYNVSATTEIFVLKKGQ